MDNYIKKFTHALAETGALFFDSKLFLKDGRPTPYFVNMAMFRSGRLGLELGSFFAEMMIANELIDKVDIILGPSYKGSSIALATSISLWHDHGHDLLFDYDRKEAKTHGESSSSKSLFVNKTFFDGCRIFIVDDVATSMGTKYDLLEKIDALAREKGETYKITGIGIGIDREQTTACYDEQGQLIPGKMGRDAIHDFISKSGIPVYSIAGIKDIIEYLYKTNVPVKVNGAMNPLDNKTKQEFDEYYKLYGV